MELKNSLLQFHRREIRAVKKSGYTKKSAQTGAVTLIQRFGSALNLNILFHMLFLDGVYIERCNGSSRFRWVKAPASRELTHLAHMISQRVGRQGLLDRDAENICLPGGAVGPQAGRKVFTLQTLSACDPEDQFGGRVGKVAGFCLHTGVAARVNERQKLERLCRYISRPAVSEKRRR